LARFRLADEKTSRRADSYRSASKAYADEVANGVHAGLAARRIRALQLRLDQLAHEQDSARRSVLTQGARAKLAEQAIEAATLGYRRLNERKELAEIIERALARSASST
jgi:hypothetical protein